MKNGDQVQFDPIFNEGLTCDCNNLSAFLRSYSGGAKLFEFRTKLSILWGTICVVVIAIGAMLLHVQINYEPELRDIVRPRALGAAVFIVGPLSYFYLFQMHKNYLLTAKLQRLVNRDRLTDVATRDFFYRSMENDPTAYGVSLMVDIDHLQADQRHIWASCGGSGDFKSGELSHSVYAFRRYRLPLWR